jgi:hypothetical protein
MERRSQPDPLIIEEIRGYATQHPSKRIHLNGHIADILSDGRSVQPVFHWFIQPEGSTEVLVWGQEASLADAEYQARTYLEGLDTRKRA